MNDTKKQLLAAGIKFDDNASEDELASLLEGSRAFIDAVTKPKVVEEVKVEVKKPSNEETDTHFFVNGRKFRKPQKSPDQVPLHECNANHRKTRLIVERDKLQAMIDGFPKWKEEALERIKVIEAKIKG